MEKEQLNTFSIDISGKCSTKTLKDVQDAFVRFLDDISWVETTHRDMEIRFAKEQD